MPFTSRLRPIYRPLIQQTHIFKKPSIRMSSTNQHGQGASHATGDSAVPHKVQEAAPKGLEESLPDGVCFPHLHLYLNANIASQVHPTGSDPSNKSTGKTHALNDGDDSIVPKKVQEAVPESVEKALPNAIHNTGSK
ncbi:hypothetical protein ACJQWK_10390 [Exserohilum turcicum]